MARGDFLGGLARGIYGEMNSQQQLQEQKDYQSKQGLIQLLTGLADKVEPQSLPLLMGHIWDTMGIKQQSSGKGLRGFLDAFSGMPNRSVEDQLGSKFRDLTKGFVGPQEAKDVRLRSNISQKGIPGLVNAAPTSEYGQKAAADVQGLNNKMVFRDPYQQKLEEIQARFGAQLETQRQRQEDAHANMITRLTLGHQNDLDRDRERHNQFVGRSVDALANTYMNHPKILALPPNQRIEAARQMAMGTLQLQTQLGIENKEKDLKVKDSIIGKNSAEGQANKPITPYQRAQLDEKVVTDVQDILGRLGPSAKNALDQEQTYGKLKKQMEAIASKRGLTYDAEAGVFLGDPIKVKVAEAFAGDTMKLTRDARDKFREAAGKAEAEHLKLKDKRFEGYLNIGNTWRDPVSVTTERTRGKAQPPPKAQKKGIGHTPSGVAPSIGSSGNPNMVRPPNLSNPTGGETFDATDPVKDTSMPGNWVKVSKDQIDARGLKTGDPYNTGGKKYVIGELKGNWYSLKPVQ